MKLFSDFEFTLVSPQPLAESMESLRQLALFGELMGSKRKNKDAEDQGRSFGYQFRQGFTVVTVMGTVTPYEQPYTGTRIDVCMSEGTVLNALAIFIYYVLMPILFVLSLLDGEHLASVLIVTIWVAVLVKWHYFDKKYAQNTQDILCQLFRATVEQPGQGASGRCIGIRACCRRWIFSCPVRTGQ